MKKSTFAEKVLKTSRGGFENVIAGRRNLSYKKAKIAASVLGTDVTVWMDPDKAPLRKLAWEEYAKEKAA